MKRRLMLELQKKSGIQFYGVQYNVIDQLEGAMQDTSSGNPPFPHRKINFLSEYESYESESPSARGRHSSARIMRKLRQLWSSQRYLTDDEIETAREQHQKEKVATNTPAEDTQREGCEKEGNGKEEISKRLHERQASSEEQILNLIRKKSNLQTVQSHEPSRNDSRDMEELQQIAAFNSEVQNQSK